MLIMNVPVSSTLSYQYVMNTITGAWCRFLGWNASCWALFNDQIYFGSPEGVCLAWDGQSDNGNNINGEALQAFSYFNSPGQLKRWSSIRPIISSNGTPGIAIGVNTNFNTELPISIPSFSPSPSAIWGASKWGQSLWGGSYNIKQDWLSVAAYGTCGALHMVTASKILKIKWSATDFIFERGAYI
jgi:hypothetical protein